MADQVIATSLIADDQVSPKVKNIKQELREAQAEVIKMSEKFGAASKEAANAAKKAAELKDRIGDAKTLVDAFNPDTKFRAFGAAIGTVTGGFAALTGAMGLLGVESESVQKQLLKVQSALAISQGVAQVQESIQSFKNLGTVLVNSLGKSGAIGLAIAGVTALGFYVKSLFSETDRLAESEKALANGTVEATKEMASLKESLNLAQRGVISKKEALDKFNDTLGKTVGKTDDLNVAERLMSENAQTYITQQGLKAQANFILQKSAEESAKAEILRQKISDASLPAFIRKQFEKQLQSDIDGLKVYDDAINVINSKLSALKFSHTLFGTGSALGGVGKSDSPSAKKGEKDAKEEKSAYQKAIDAANQAIAEKETQDMMDKHMRARVAINDQNNYVVKAAVDMHSQIHALDLARTSNESNMVEARKKLTKEEAEAKLNTMMAVSNALTSLGDLLGEQTAAGKVLGIAGAVINTYVGATKALAQGGILGIASAAAVIASGLASVKKIIAVKVPKEKGSPSVGAASAPLKPQLAQATSTRLDQQQLNQIGNATVRAFVVEHDMTTNQERVRRLNKAARL